jgi:hypothetical protein
VGPHRLYRNWVSYAGVVIAVLAFVVFGFLLIFQALGAGIRAPYAGLVIFILVPAVLLAGLLLIPVGMFFEWWRWKRNKPPSMGLYPKLDLNDPGDRKAVLYVATATLVLVFCSVYGSYRAYEYTESVSFCGTLCHREMQPEYVTHNDSPHARVRCVECHVGPGAEWFVRSKEEGIRQIYEVVTNSVPRPIPAPIERLRPARAICEQCHWPAVFVGDKEVPRIHFLPDKQNTRWTIALLLKVGGSSPWNPQSLGIHWHVASNIRVEYIATDKARQNIPWVRRIDLKTGRTTTFATSGAPSQEEMARSQIRTMDCMDCHDRPTHIFRSPSNLLNRAMAAGYIAPSLPDVKSVGVSVLAKKYDSREAAFQQISSGMQSHYPDLARARKPVFSAAVSRLQQVYQDNFFPYMKVRWDTYFDNIGHMDSLGCYRCHDGLHKSSSGEVVGKECTKCHTIIREGTPEKMSYSSEPQGLPFQHPVSISGLWQVMSCNQCHTGAVP